METHMNTHRVRELAYSSHPHRSPPVRAITEARDGCYTTLVRRAGRRVPVRPGTERCVRPYFIVMYMYVI